MAKRERENKRVKTWLKAEKGEKDVRTYDVRKGKMWKARQENEKIGNIQVEEGINKRRIVRTEIALRGCRVGASSTGKNFCSKQISFTFFFYILSYDK